MVMCCIFKLALMLLAFHGCQSHLRILSSPFVQASFCILDALRPTSTFTELRGLSEFFLLEYFLLFAPKIYVPACRTLQKSERGREQLCDAYVLDKQLFLSVRCFSFSSLSLLSVLLCNTAAQTQGLCMMAECSTAELHPQLWMLVQDNR